MNLKELAEQLDLSQATVSRALNGYPEVREATRQRVLDAARKYNYRPNTRALGLATGKSMAIGHIIPIYSKNEVVNPVFGEFIAGASQTYSANGYELLLTIADSQDEEAAYRNIVAKGAVDGVIIHSPRKEDSRVQLLQDIGLPFVIHGRVNDTMLPYSWIDTNNRRAFHMATKLLIDLGHQRIALINGRETLNFAWLRRQGYDQAMQAAGLQTDPEIISGDELTEPQFTATRSSVRHAGVLAAQMLLDIIEDPSRAPLSELLEAQLTIGASTGPLQKNLALITI